MSAEQDVVRLSVGGVEYCTTRATLTQYPDSMLGAMFSGHLPSTRLPDGSYFVDRDGHLFSYVLNFLRSSRLSLPQDFKLLDALSVEADFYQIEPLIRAVTEARLRGRGRLLEVVELRTSRSNSAPKFKPEVKTTLIASDDTMSSVTEGLTERGIKVVGKQTELTEVTVNGLNARLRVGEYLLDNGWILQHSDLSSSSIVDKNNAFSYMVVEQTYRDRWLLPDS